VIGMTREEFVIYVHSMLQRVIVGKPGVYRKPATG
jgi:hypothetical protein